MTTDSGEKIGVVFVDFHEASDTVDHNILESKLSPVGVSGVFHEWVSSYLSNRSQYVTII